MKKSTQTLLFIILGGLLGYLYFLNWGCTSGCAIRSSPLLMTLYGALLGYLLPGIFKKKPEKTE